MARPTTTGHGPPRWQPLAVVGGALVVVLAVVGLVSLPEQPSESTTVPQLAISTTVPRTTTTRGIPGYGEFGIILGAGWEELDLGPVAGRQDISAVWTGSGLFAWGGYTFAPGDDPDARVLLRYINTGALWNPGTETWSDPIVPPERMCALEQTRLIWLDLNSATSHPIGPIHGNDGYVLIYGERPSASDCESSMLFRPSDGTWHEFDVLGGITPLTNLVWVPRSAVGPLLVFPGRGAAYQVPDPVSQGPIDIPRLVQPFDPRARLTATRMFSSGGKLVSWGLDSVRTWSFGDETWHDIADAPIPQIGRDAVWTRYGLLMVNQQMAAAALDPGTERWNRFGDIPLRFYECVPEATAVAGTPVIRTCSGLAIWDEVTFNWVPIPFENVLGSPQNGTLIGGDDAIYSIGPSFRRFVIQRDDTGRVRPPGTIPIGVMQLDVPEGWEFAYSFAPSVHVSGTMPDDETIGVAFESGDVSCRVASTYAPFGWSPPPDASEVEEISLGPTGTLHGVAYEVDGQQEGEAGLLFSAPVGNGTDWITIRCSAPAGRPLSEAVAAFGSLWLPSEGRPYVPIPIEMGPGWEELDDSVDAGRLGVSAIWTGTELFAWGGWDGDDWDPDPPAIFQGGNLFDPATGEWRPAAAVPDGLCSLIEADVSMMDDLVLVRGSAQDRTDCHVAATYDLADHYWTVLESPFFDMVPVGSDVVWTGEWLAAPTTGLAYLPAADGGQMIAIPDVPESGSRVGSPTLAHWTGDRIVAVGSGDVFTLVPGDDEWARLPGPPVPEGGRDSVWADGWLYVVTYDNHAARFDLYEWEQANLPLRSSECDTDVVLAGAYPVARSCSGLAIWDLARGFWVPVPSDLVSGDTWWTTIVGSDGAVYSLGERFLRYPIERHADGSLFDPEAIPVGPILLPLPDRDFSLRSTIGLTRTEWPDGSIGEVSVFLIDAPGGTCRVESRYAGPELPFDLGRVLVFDAQGRSTDWFLFTVEHEGDIVLSVGDGVDSVWVSCDSDEDERLLAGGVWLPGSTVSVADLDLQMVDLP